ncbi:hypothetical protein [Kaarinaea lacus]
MKNLLLFVSVVSTLLALTGCPSKPVESGLTPKEAAEARRTIVAWLECEDCTDKELEKVVGLGKTAVPTLIACLDQGPSAANRELYRLHLVEAHKKLVDYGRDHPDAAIKMNQDDYVKMYMENYEALYRIRSATALSSIGGKEAREALEKAAKKENQRKDVDTTIRTSLEAMK